jgi:hypothetical protein
VKLVVQRDTFTANSTTGELSIDGVFECFTLEPRSDRSQGKPYCIPPGTYPILLQMSERFQMLTPHLQDVPGFTEIEIHPGNYPPDTEGCTLVGATSGTDMVGSSRLAFEALMAKLNSATDAIMITYVGGAIQ